MLCWWQIFSWANYIPVCAFLADCVHTASVCSTLPVGWGSAESPALVAKYIHVETFDQETWSIFCSAITFFSSTLGFTLHSAVPKHAKATSG